MRLHSCTGCADSSQIYKESRWWGINATWKVITLPASATASRPFALRPPSRFGSVVRLQLKFITSHPLEMEAALPFPLLFLQLNKLGMTPKMKILSSTSHPLEMETALPFPLLFLQLNKPRTTPKMKIPSSTSHPSKKGTPLLFALLFLVVLRHLRGPVRRNLPCPAKRSLLNRSIVNSPT